MTIPIEPGPFSFLPGIGQALGAYATQKEENRQTRLKEAKDQAHNFIALRLAGLMKPKDFDTPEVQAVFHMAGFGPVTSDETPEELSHIMQGSYLRGLINPAEAKPMSDEQRVAAGAPERGLSEGIDAKVAGAKAAVPQANLAGATAEAQIPRAGMTAQVGQVGQQGKTATSIADTWIEAQYAKTKKLPKNGAEAFAAASADPNIGPLAQQLGQSFFDQAIETLRAKLAKEATERAMAEARAKGASGTGLDDYLRIYSTQQQRLNDQLKSLDKPSSTDQMMAGVAAQQRARGKTPSPLMVQAEGRVSEYGRRRQEIEQQLQQIGDQITQVTGGKIGAPGVTPPGQSDSPQRRAARLEYEQKVQGITDPAKRKAIGEQIAKKYNIGVGGAK